MTIEEVVRLRTALKCGKNLPLRVLTDNDLFVIDESHRLQFTKWDDTNGVLYLFRLIDMQTDTSPSNRQQAISVSAVSYTFIEAIELPRLPLNDIDNLFETIEASGCTFNGDFKNLIKRTYTEVLHPERYQLSPSDMNTIIGPDAVNDKDDYYYNKYKESTKETLRYADRNKSIDENNP